MKTIVITVLIVLSFLFYESYNFWKRQKALGYLQVFPAITRTQETGCTYNGSLPDPECTPGAVFRHITPREMCVSGYARTMRDVSNKLKEEVYVDYGITEHKPGDYEVDHLVSLQLGGSNEISNLWPQPVIPHPGFREKHRVDTILHDAVCAGELPLAEAQWRSASNWVKVLSEDSESIDAFVADILRLIQEIPLRLLKG